jgi:hypothetical protein
MRYHDRIVCALAGLQAQRRVTRQNVRSSDANGDEVLASELLLRLHAEERERICAFGYLQARARNLVNNQWPLIENLAKALLKYQLLRRLLQKRWAFEAGDEIPFLRAAPSTRPYTRGLRRLSRGLRFFQSATWAVAR